MLVIIVVFNSLLLPFLTDPALATVLPNLATLNLILVLQDSCEYHLVHVASHWIL